MELAKLAREELPEGSKRALSYKIRNNIGLVRVRPKKSGTTAHSRMRHKFEKKNARYEKVTAVRAPKQNYSGEVAINPRVVRSTTF